MINLLPQILVTTEDGLRLVPEIYSVPEDKVEEEYKQPGSQQRQVCGKLPFKWAQSLYVVGRLLQDVRITPFLPISLLLYSNLLFTALVTKSLFHPSDSLLIVSSLSGHQLYRNSLHVVSLTH